MPVTEFLGGDRQGVEHAAEILRNGGIVAIPTETVYGLAANALDREAVRRIFLAKGRPSHNPLIVHVAGEEQACGLAGTWPEEASILARAFWPGPLTMVVPAGGTIAPEALANGSTVGLRAPGHPLALGIIRACGLPLAAPSANTSNAISPTTAEAVMADLGGRIDAVVEGGPCQVGIESTVLDLTGDKPMILRPGMITGEEIAAVLGRDVALAAGIADGALKSPGQLARHYAPRIPLFLVEQPSRDEMTFCIEIGETESWLADRVILPLDAVVYARALYRALKWGEHSGRSRIHLQLPPHGGHWHAIHDRLRRAAHPAT